MLGLGLGLVNREKHGEDGTYPHGHALQKIQASQHGEVFVVGAGVILAFGGRVS